MCTAKSCTAGLVPTASDGFTSTRDCCPVPSFWDPMSHGACVTAVGPTVLQAGRENELAGVEMPGC